jgi:hypothetical protein
MDGTWLGVNHQQVLEHAGTIEKSGEQVFKSPKIANMSV